VARTAYSVELQSMQWLKAALSTEQSATAPLAFASKHFIHCAATAGQRKLPLHSRTASASLRHELGFPCDWALHDASAEITDWHAMSAPSPIVRPPETLRPNSVRSFICPMHVLAVDQLFCRRSSACWLQQLWFEYSPMGDSRQQRRLRRAH
jgi:hypothetical protein